MKKERNEFRKMKILNKKKKERKIFICINLKQNTVSKIHLCSYYLNMKTDNICTFCHFFKPYKYISIFWWID